MVVNLGTYKAYRFSFSSGIRTSEAGASAFFATDKAFSQEGLTVGKGQGKPW